MPVSLSPRIEHKWCHPCNRREAAHLDGRCLMAHTHPLTTCVICGRPSTERYCSDACYRADEEPTGTQR